jgi:hypothetical protein
MAHRNSIAVKGWLELVKQVNVDNPLMEQLDE